MVNIVVTFIVTLICCLVGLNGLKKDIEKYFLLQVQREAENKKRDKLATEKTETIFQSIRDAHHKWRIYYGGI